MSVDFITTPLMRDSVVRLGNLDWNDVRAFGTLHGYVLSCVGVPCGACAHFLCLTPFQSNPNEFNNFTFGRRLMAGQNDVRCEP